MTPRERKYHKLQKSKRLFNRLFNISNLGMLVPGDKRPFKYFEDGRLVESTEPRPPVTITLTKYNQPRNYLLQKGQLN